MRKNLPVTNNEYPIGEDTLIVSKTDLKGKLTYFNEQFVLASGFDDNELMGQPHNIVRHPDMPPAAFEDLWQTLKDGKPWAGAVKNRRKNGDFYWVLASATPMPTTKGTAIFDPVTMAATRLWPACRSLPKFISRPTKNMKIETASWASTPSVGRSQTGKRWADRLPRTLGPRTRPAMTSPITRG